MEDAPETAPSGHKRRRACTSGGESEEDDAESFDDDPSEDMTTEAGTSADIANQSDAADVTRQLQARVRYADDEPNWDEVKRDAEEIGLSDAWLQGQKTAREKLWAAVKQVLPRLDPPHTTSTNYCLPSPSKHRATPHSTFSFSGRGGHDARWRVGGRSGRGRGGSKFSVPSTCAAPTPRQASGCAADVQGARRHGVRKTERRQRC